MRPQPPEPGTAGLPEFVLDGTSFDDLAGFFTAITRTLSVTGWGRNLDAFNDILRGGFGTPRGRIHPAMGQLRYLRPAPRLARNDPLHSKRSSPPATRPTSPPFRPTWQRPGAEKARPSSTSSPASSGHTALAASKPKTTSISSSPEHHDSPMGLTKNMGTPPAGGTRRLPGADRHPGQPERRLHHHPLTPHRKDSSSSGHPGGDPSALRGRTGSPPGAPLGMPGCRAALCGHWPSFPQCMNFINRPGPREASAAATRT